MSKPKVQEGPSPSGEVSIDVTTKPLHRPRMSPGDLFPSYSMICLHDFSSASKADQQGNQSYNSIVQADVKDLYIRYLSTVEAHEDDFPYLSLNFAYVGELLRQFMDGLTDVLDLESSFEAFWAAAPTNQKSMGPDILKHQLIKHVLLPFLLSVMDDSKHDALKVAMVKDAGEFMTAFFQREEASLQKAMMFD